MYIIQLPHSTLRLIVLNSNSAPVSRSSKNVILQEFRKNCSCFCMWSTMCIPKKIFPVKALLYCHSKRSMCKFQITMDHMRVPSALIFSPYTHTTSLVLCCTSCMVVTMWKHWPRNSPDSSLERQSFTITNRTWTHIARCCVFYDMENYGGLRRGDSSVGASRSGIANICPWRRAWKNDVFG